MNQPIKLREIDRLIQKKLISKHDGESMKHLLHTLNVTWQEYFYIRFHLLINFHPVEMDSWSNFLWTNFLANILQLTNFKMPPTFTSIFCFSFLFFARLELWFIYVNKVTVQRLSEIFQNSFLKNGLLKRCSRRWLDQS